MKKILKGIITLITIQCLLQSCDFRRTKCINDYKVRIVNNSPTRVYYHFYWNYPDTLIGEYNPLHDGTDGLTTGESFVRGTSLGFCWNDIIDDGKKQFIYFFNADTLSSIPWDTVRKTQRGLLERREISLDYFNQNNFTIAYP